jgi:hypothetical protein
MCTGLTSITIPEGIISIGEQAFRQCSGLTYLVIPSTVKTIGVYAFTAANITIYSEGQNPESDESLNFNSNWNANNGGLVYWVGEWHYEDGVPVPNPSLLLEFIPIKGDTEWAVAVGTETSEYIVIPSTRQGKAVTQIAAEGFYGSDFLKGVKIPNSVTEIGNQAFAWAGLTSITIPDSVTTIGFGAFQSCTSLTKITLPFVGNTLDGTTNTWFGYIFGISVASGQYGLGESKFTSLKTVVVTGGTIIGDNAFAFCTGLTSITIPEGVTTISDYAFRECTGLTSLTIPSTVTTISGYAFMQCSNITYFIIPSNVTTIRAFAFDECDNATIYSEGQNPESDESLNFERFWNIGRPVYWVGEWHYEDGVPVPN